MPPFGSRGPLPTRAFLSRFQHQDIEQMPWASYLARQIQSSMQPDVIEPGQGMAQSLPIKSRKSGTEAKPSSTASVPEYPTLLGSQFGCRCATPSRKNMASSHVSTAAITGNVWRLSQDPQGSREVQHALEQAAADISDITVDDVAAELGGHVMEAMRCPHANFVLQKCITPGAPNATRWLLEELMSEGPDAICQVARHRFGCRVIERLLEICDPEQVAPLADQLLDDALALCTHPYGNYTMQHLLAHGQRKHRHGLAEILQTNAANVGSNFYGSAVVGQAMKHVDHEDQVDLARALLHVPGLLVSMARSKHGHSAARLAMQALDGPEREAARREFCVESPGLCNAQRKV